MGKLKQVFNKLTAWNQRNREIVKHPLKTIGGLYKEHVINPQVEMNKELAQFNFDKNKEMWDLQNQYNTPQAQRDRMEQAGFNPNYMAGGGASSTGSASPASMPQYNAQAPTLDPMGFYGRIVQAAQGLMSIRKQVADVQKVQAQTAGSMLDSRFKKNTMGVREGNLWQHQSSMYAQEQLATQLHAFRGGYKAGDTITPYSQKGGLFDMQKTALQSQIDNMNAKTFFQRWQNDLTKFNITSSDNPWFRMGMQVLNSAGVNPNNWIKSASQGLSEHYGKR